MDVFTKAALTKEPGHMQVIKALPRAIWTTVLLLAASFASNGCGDVSSVSTTPAAAPAQLTILTTSPLPDGTVNVQYSVALAASGGTPGYTWSLATNSPQL